MSEFNREPDPEPVTWWNRNSARIVWFLLAVVAALVAAMTGRQIPLPPMPGL